MTRSRHQGPVASCPRSGGDRRTEDTQNELVLATGPTAVVRVARSDIASVQASQVSVMATGLDKQLSSQEIADLLAFLKASQ